MYTSCRPHARAFHHHHPADLAQRGGGQPGLLPAAAWRWGGAAPRASLVAARTATEEAVYEVVLRQAALVEDLQGRRAAREADTGQRRRWRDEQLEQEGDAELGWGLLGDAYDRCGEVCAEYAKTFYLDNLFSLKPNTHAYTSDPLQFGNYGKASMDAAATAPTPLPTPHGDSVLSRVLRVPANKPITLRFIDDSQGFMLGNDYILLHVVGSARVLNHEEMGHVDCYNTL
ncbi:hypothetical protein CFC21_009045 [Triticum aestivum]|uniref:Uncharacterized protein n=2 Tax=Triticum aestivum TaxID=4565 RepID=A0A9R1DHV5_WHEAT|nr:uncharacterized protein LOC123146215 isoform X2 [Triticum aestivum]KAF6992005.1 hypothetical protein CFC21_009045 [Triticum aestivum]